MFLYASMPLRPYAPMPLRLNASTPLSPCALAPFLIGINTLYK